MGMAFPGIKRGKQVRQVDRFIDVSAMKRFFASLRIYKGRRGL
jgi:hypothetical protein